MLEIKLDRGSPTPPYLQVVNQVRDALRMGWLVPGDRLPSVREVVASSGINPNTVSKAYRELGLLGLIESRQGAGSYVTATLGHADPHAMVKFRVQLEGWVARARAAGLDLEDLKVLAAAVLNESGSARSSVAG